MTRTQTETTGDHADPPTGDHVAATRLRWARAELMETLQYYGHSGPQRRTLHRVADAIQRAIDDLDRPAAHV